MKWLSAHSPCACRECVCVRVSVHHEGLRAVFSPSDLFLDHVSVWNTFEVKVNFQVRQEEFALANLRKDHLVCRMIIKFCNYLPSIV